MKATSPTARNLARILYDFSHFAGVLLSSKRELAKAKAQYRMMVKASENDAVCIARLEGCMDEEDQAAQQLWCCLDIVKENAVTPAHSIGGKSGDDWRHGILCQLDELCHLLAGDRGPRSLRSELTADIENRACELLRELEARIRETRNLSEAPAGQAGGVNQLPDGFYAPSDIAKALGASDKADAIRKTLKRLFDDDRLPGGAWMENSNPAKGQAKILFSLSGVKPFLSKYIATSPE